MKFETDETCALHSLSADRLIEELFCGTDDRKNDTKAVSSDKRSSEETKPLNQLGTNSVDEPKTEQSTDDSKISEKKISAWEKCNPTVRIKPDVNDPNWPLANHRLGIYEHWMDEAEAKFDQYDKDKNGFLHSSELAGINQGWSDYLSATYDRVRINFKEHRTISYNESIYSPPLSLHFGSRKRTVAIKTDNLGVSKADIMYSMSRPTKRPEIEPRYCDDFINIINDRAIDEISNKYKWKPAPASK